MILTLLGVHSSIYSHLQLKSFPKMAYLATQSSFSFPLQVPLIGSIGCGIISRIRIKHLELNRWVAFSICALGRPLAQVAGIGWNHACCNVLPVDSPFEERQRHNWLIERNLVSRFINPGEWKLACLFDLSMNNSIRCADVLVARAIKARRVHFFRNNLPPEPVTIVILEVRQPSTLLWGEM